jgi:hypothetical protein
MKAPNSNFFKKKPDENSNSNSNFFKKKPDENSNSNSNSNFLKI